MEIKTATSFAGFLVALATLNLPAMAAVNSPQGEASSPDTSETSPSSIPASSIGDRLTRLTDAIREREAQFPELPLSAEEMMLAGWANGRGGAWVNARRGGWGDRSGGGGFANFNPWRNGWGDRGGFFNHNPWRNGGGGWLNRR